MTLFFYLEECHDDFDDGVNFEKSNSEVQNESPVSTDENVEAVGGKKSKDLRKEYLPRWDIYSSVHCFCFVSQYRLSRLNL